VRRQVLPYNIRVGSIAPGTVANELWGIYDEAEIARRVAEHSALRSEDVVEAILFMLAQPEHVTIRDLVMLPQGFDL
jgi:ribitol 2-dehydrogenase